MLNFSILGQVYLEVNKTHTNTWYVPLEFHAEHL